MMSYFEGREGGGGFRDMYRTKDQRHLHDQVANCLVSELPYADRKRGDEKEQREARQAYTMANNSHKATAATHANTFVRIEGGQQVTYYGSAAERLIRQRKQQDQLIPRPPTTTSRVEDAGLFIDGEGPAKPSGRRRVPLPPQRREVPEEIPLFGGGPRTLMRTYHAVDPGWCGETDRDILFNDKDALCTPSKKEYTHVSKASLPNTMEAAARARLQRSHTASARLPTVWKRPNYAHGWLAEEARKDDAVYKSIWRQQQERNQRRQHAEANLKIDSSRLKGAAVSMASPRYKAEAQRAADEQQALSRRDRLEKEAARYEAALLRQREDARISSDETDEGKRLSSKMRHEIGATFKRLQL